MRHRFSPTPVAGIPLHHTASRAPIPRGESDAAHPATGLLCNYGCGRPVVAFISLLWGDIGWCSKHLTKVDDWPARLAGEMA